MDQYLRIRESVAFTFSSAGKQERSHRHGDTDTDGRDVGLDELHGVVHGEPGVDVPSWTIDVEGDVLVRIVGFEMQQLGHDQVRHLIVDRCPQEDNALVEQARVDIVGSFAAAGLLDHHRDEWTHGVILSP